MKIDRDSKELNLEDGKYSISAEDTGTLVELIHALEILPKGTLNSEHWGGPIRISLEKGVVKIGNPSSYEARDKLSWNIPQGAKQIVELGEGEVCFMYRRRRYHIHNKN
jgi:hypothetical protein